MNAVSRIESLLHRALGREPGVRSVRKFGYNGAVTSAGFEDIWAGGGNKSLPTTAMTMNVRAGGDATDTVAGVGARKVLISGLDENWDEATEVIDLAGASESAATTTTFIRVNRAYVTAVGTYNGSNADDIVIEDSANDVRAVIPQGLGQTAQSHYAVPRYHRAVLLGGIVSCDGTSSVGCDMRFLLRENGNVVSDDMGATREIFRLADVKTAFTIPGFGGSVVEPYSDIWWQARRTSGGGSALVSTSYTFAIVFIPELADA